MAAGGHFWYFALLQIVAQIFEIGMTAYFVVNTLNNKNKSWNFTSRRLVTKLKFRPY